METRNERLKILDMIDQGVINAGQGLQLLEALNNTELVNPKEDSVEGAPTQSIQTDNTSPQLSPEEETHSPDEMAGVPELAHWKRWWLIPFIAGAGLAILSAPILIWIWLREGFTIWVIFGFVPVISGLSIALLAWLSRKAPWLHIRIQQRQAKPHHLAFGFPVPVKLTATLIRTFGKWIPALDRTGVDELITALQFTAKDGTPLYVHVNDEDGAEQVQVYLG